jgi:transcriptional regulator with XRE-family HTH domain
LVGGNYESGLDIINISNNAGGSRMDIGRKIQEHREKNGLSQEALAEKIGVSRQSISKWELGQALPEVDKIVQLSQLFGVSTDSLLHGEKPMYNKPSRQLVCINVPTPDTKRFVEFYNQVLGATILEPVPGRYEVFFGNVEERSPDNRGMIIVPTHDPNFKKTETNACQGFEILVDNADAEYERIKNIGVEIAEPPKNVPWGYRFFHLKDPDGNGVDIIQVLLNITQ